MQAVITLWRRYRYRNWTLKDIAIVGCTFVFLVVLKFILPQIFKNTDAKLLDKISWGIAFVVMGVLLFAIY